MRGDDMDRHRGVQHTVMPEQTLVMDGAGRQLLWIDGVLPLPEGSRIELMEPRADGVVERVRLWGAAQGVVPLLVLVVRLETP
jgi:hypothetical protein